MTCVAEGCDQPQHYPRRGLCRPCYQRAWRNGNLDRYPPSPAARPPHDCAKHTGPSRACYAICGCRCRGCANEHATYERGRRRSQAYGTWHPYVDAEPVAKHLRNMMAPAAGSKDGVGRRTISQQTGVPTSTITQILNGRRARVTVDTARKLMSFRGRPRGAAKINAAATRKQIAQLVDAGFTPTELARYVTGNPTARSTAVTTIGKLVTADRADQVAELHALWSAGRVVPRGRQQRGLYGPPSPFPASVPDGCEVCGGDTLAGGRWCFTHFKQHATPVKDTGCGTDAGYARHRRAGQTPCQSCREAHNLANELRKAG